MGFERRLISSRGKHWMYLVAYAWLVLFVNQLFQAPLVPLECQPPVDEQGDGPGEAEGMPWCALVFSSIGLFRIHTERGQWLVLLELAVMWLLADIQQRIFSHPSYPQLVMHWRDEFDVRGRQRALQYERRDGIMRQLYTRRLEAWGAMQAAKLRRITERLQTIRFLLLASGANPNASASQVQALPTLLLLSFSCLLCAPLACSPRRGGPLPPSVDRSPPPPPPPASCAPQASGSTASAPAALESQQQAVQLQRSDEVDVGVSALAEAGFDGKRAAAALVACGAGGKRAQEVLGSYALHRALTLLLQVELELVPPSALHLREVTKRCSTRRVQPNSLTFALLEDIKKEEGLDIDVGAARPSPMAGASASKRLRNKSRSADGSTADGRSAMTARDPSRAPIGSVGFSDLWGSRSGAAEGTTSRLSGRNDSAGDGRSSQPTSDASRNSRVSFAEGRSLVASSAEPDEPGAAADAPEAAEAAEAADSRISRVSSLGETEPDDTVLPMKPGDQTWLQWLGENLVESLTASRDPVLFPTKASPWHAAVRATSMASPLGEASRQQMPDAPQVSCKLLLHLVGQVIASNTFWLLGLMMIVNHAINANIISMVFPLSLLLYGAIDSPRPSSKFVDAVIVYTLLVITAKFLYQLPIFCGTPPFTFRQNVDGQALCAGTTTTSAAFLATLPERIDYKIGLHKFSKNVRCAAGPDTRKPPNTPPPLPSTFTSHSNTARQRPPHASPRCPRRRMPPIAHECPSPNVAPFAVVFNASRRSRQFVARPLHIDPAATGPHHHARPRPGRPVLRGGGATHEQGRHVPHELPHRRRPARTRLPRWLAPLLPAPPPPARGGKEGRRPAHLVLPRTAAAARLQRVRLRQHDTERGWRWLRSRQQ